MPFKALLTHIERVEPLIAAQPWLVVGVAVVVGYVVGKLAAKLKLPEVVGYIVGGLLLGPSLTNLFTLELLERMDLVSDLALALVAFTIGTELMVDLLKRLGRGLFVVTLAESSITFLVVAAGVYLLGRDLPLALILGAVAAASAPAGTVVVLQEYKAKGTLTSLLLAIVGLDDGVGVMIYAFAISIAKLFVDHSTALSFAQVVQGPILEILGAIALGACIGVLLALAVRKARTTGEMLTMVLGGTLICAGMSNLFGVSLILANLVVGAAVANISPRSVRRAFGAVQNITGPIYILFFVLAGAHLQVKLLLSMGAIGLIYIVSRCAGKMTGASLGAAIARMEPRIRKYVGLGLLSQAGLAVGLALMVGRELGDLGADGARLALVTINTVAATTIVFEFIGPVTLKAALTGAGEIGKMQGESGSEEVS